MGVTGLWRLIEPTGKPVPVETLENKVLAVDISIWLHQMVKGYQDAKGAPLPNAHLIGLFQRLCKLLFFRIRPVFVFDGGFPDLKRETIGKRQDNKAKYSSQSERLKREIALLLGKKTAIGSLLGKQIPLKKTNPIENNDDIFKLPALPEKDQESESESEDEGSSSTSSIDLHTVDLESDKFKNLPVKDKYDLLIELKETRKMNSWGKLHTLPKKSDNFSDFQMQRLLKRRKVQECLEETEKEMGEGSMSLNELESLLNEEGIDTKIESLPSRRIASNDTTRYLLISSVKQALAEAKKKKDIETVKPPEESSQKTNTDIKPSSTKDSELEDDLQKAIKMSLECVEEQDTTANTSKTDDSWTSYLSDSDYSDSEDEDGFVHSDMSTAKAYIMQYSDFTHKAIDDIVIPKQKSTKKSKGNETNVEQIIEELNKEKPIIEEMELSSEDDFTKVTQNVQTSFSSKLDAINYRDKKVLMLNDTEKSIIFVDNSNEIINLDTSTEDKEDIVEDQSRMRANVSEFEDVDKNKIKSYNTIKTTTQTKEKTTSHNTDGKSVIYDQSDNKIILNEKEKANEKAVVHNHSESSEDEFEEVAETEGTFKVPVVQLTLNLGEEIKDDDIFADVFEDNVKKDIISIEKKENLDKIDENVNGKLLMTSKKPIPPKNIAVLIPERNVTVNRQEVTNEKKTNEKILNTIHITETQNNEPNDTILKEKLNSIVSEIEDKEVDLVQEKSRLDRMGRNITEQMTKEAQELLQIFGIPYIIAPMEAEAQCAFLESVKLTDGTITDDSDIWLFGGQTVYKNFFNQKKHVLQYLSEKIEKSFNLTREQLVLLALLVGSDYTTGITGVGPVTALEILASFPFNRRKLITVPTKQAQYQEIINGLIDFKKWVKAGKRTDNISLKKKLKNITLTDDFPSLRVVQAYMEPNIEKSEEKFTWGDLDVTILRDYTKQKFGWSQNKLDEIIKPVLKRMQDRKNQKTVHDYFKRKTDFYSLEDQMSKRVKAAVQKMGPDGSIPNTSESEENNKIKKLRKRKICTTKRTGKIGETGNIEGCTSALEVSKNTDNIRSIPIVIKSQDLHDNEQKFHININKTERLQEIIPQREKDKQSMLQNKLKAIETFRKTKIDPKSRTSKRKLPEPKEDAGLSESSDSN